MTRPQGPWPFPSSAYTPAATPSPTPSTAPVDMEPQDDEHRSEMDRDDASWCADQDMGDQ